MFTLVTFVPPSHTEAVLDALFAAGAGRFRNYDRCAFVSRGEGRFRPVDDAVPFLGEKGKEETVTEDRIECLVAGEFTEAALKALRVAHPYEEPAVYLYKLDSRCLGGASAGQDF